MDKRSLADFVGKRQEMIDKIRREYSLDSPRVLSVMLRVPRDEFVSRRYKGVSYDDRPVPIGCGQTMSQPYTVAFMTHLALEMDKPHFAKASRGKKVLEIGTGSGYQAAILSLLAKEVYTIEIIPELAERAKKTLKNLDYKNIHVKVGSGEWGWPEAASFDAILITAAIEEKVPEVLFEQLKKGGILVAPIGGKGLQTMTRFRKTVKGMIQKEEFQKYVFVPFVYESD